MDTELAGARVLCPIFRIGQTPDHEPERVDLELATEHHCFKNVAGSHWLPHPRARTGRQSAQATGPAENHGARRGKRSSLFTRQILNNGHTSVHDHSGYGSIYRLFSITLYSQIEKGNFRNHRVPSFEFIPAQLIVVDFILEHRGIEHLEPEYDKVNFFCEQLGLSIGFLPGKVSEGGMESRLTICYLVDTSPLFLALRLPGSSPVVTLSYLDSGIETIAGFLTHLGAYQLLFPEPSSFRGLCISPKHPQSARGKERFRSVVKNPLEFDVSDAPTSFRGTQGVRKLPVRNASNRGPRIPERSGAPSPRRGFVGLHRAWNLGELDEQDLRREFCPIKADRAARRIWGKSLASHRKKS